MTGRTVRAMQTSTAFALAMSLAAAACAHEPDRFKDIRYSGVVQRDDHGRTKRSAAVINAFRKQWPCPSTGKTTDACPGWAVDHVVPLACGGVDAVWNMAWMPMEGKSGPGELPKDRWERRVYGGNGVSAGCP